MSCPVKEESTPPIRDGRGSAHRGSASIWLLLLLPVWACGNDGHPESDTPRPRTVTVELRGQGSGDVTSLPAGIQCPGTCVAELPSATSVRLIARPSEGMVFEGWSGACQGQTECLVGASGDAQVVATFEPMAVRRARSFGGANSESLGAVAAAADGAIALVGTFNESMDLGAGTHVSVESSQDGFVALFDVGGATRWSKSFGNYLTDEARAVAFDALGNVFVAGNFEHQVDFGGGLLTSAGLRDAVVVSYSAAGAHRWSRRFGGSGAEDARGLAVGPDGSVVVVGRFASSVDFGAGPRTSSGGSDIFVVRLASDGRHLWSQTLGGTGHDEATAVAVDQHGNITLVGTFEQTVDFGGGALTSAGLQDAFAIGLTSDGGLRWVRTWGAEGADIATSVASDRVTGWLVSGGYAARMNVGDLPLASVGGSDAYLLKLTETGAPVFVKSFGDSGDDRASAVAVSPDGSVVLTGFIEAQVSFGGPPLGTGAAEDAFLAKFSPTGAHVWSEAFGGSDTQVGSAVCIDRAGNIAAAGLFRGAVAFGGEQGTNSHGGLDVFLFWRGP